MKEETGHKMILSIYPKKILVDGVLMRVHIERLVWHENKEYKYLREPNAKEGFWYDCQLKQKVENPNNTEPA